MYDILKDGSRESNKYQKIYHLQRKFQNVPVLSLKMKNLKKQGCSLYPNILDINFSNTYWQIFKSHGSTFYLHGAYFGSREIIVETIPILQ